MKVHTCEQTMPSIEQVQSWLAEIPDPEMPAISITDLGIVRDVMWQQSELVVVVTPTYSGCPATDVIASTIQQVMKMHGIECVKVKTQLSPAWTTEWLSEKARQQLAAQWIVPPLPQKAEPRELCYLHSTPVALQCPHCNSMSTQQTSEFGSTPCKSLYVCSNCRNPFEHFKCH